MCQGCQGQQARRRIVNGIDVVNATPTSLRKQFYDLRIPLCRACSFFNRLTWFCRQSKKDCRVICKDPNFHCELPISKW